MAMHVSQGGRVGVGDPAEIGECRVQPGSKQRDFSLRIALGGLPGGASRFRRLGLDLDLTFAATAGLHLNPARLGTWQRCRSTAPYPAASPMVGERLVLVSIPHR